MGILVSNAPIEIRQTLRVHLATSSGDYNKLRSMLTVMLSSEAVYDASGARTSGDTARPDPNRMDVGAGKGKDGKKGKGKGKETKGKDHDKGKGTDVFQGNCGFGGNWGHKRADCRKRAATEATTKPAVAAVVLPPAPGDVGALQYPWWEEEGEEDGETYSTGWVMGISCVAPIVSQNVSHRALVDSGSDEHVCPPWFGLHGGAIVDNVADVKLFDVQGNVLETAEVRQVPVLLGSPGKELKEALISFRVTPAVRYPVLSA